MTSRAGDIAGPFDKMGLAAARRLVDAYDIVLRREDDGWVGHALEYPEAIGVGQTVQKCMDETRKSLLAGVASTLEDGEPRRSRLDRTCARNRSIFG